jgi:hypothetical protein
VGTGVPWREPQISPLRSFGAPVEMTKGRAALPGRVSCRTGVAQEETAEPQVPPLRCAPVGMTRGKGATSGRVVAETGTRSGTKGFGWASPTMFGPRTLVRT